MTSKRRKVRGSRVNARRKEDSITCGRVSCTGSLAAVRDGWITTLPGWPLPRDGVWRLSRAARERQQRGEGLRFERPVFRAVEQGGALAGRYFASPVWARNYIDEPTVFLCPRCGAINTVDPGALLRTP